MIGGLRVVAIVAAKDNAETVGGTVAALGALPAVDRVLVVDDGSRDGTADAASLAGAGVLQLPANVGKGGAVAAGVGATPEADVYLLVDADVGKTASLAGALLEPIADGAADLTVAVLPAAGARGGFGWVRRLAGAVIGRATGRQVRAPLSGQRAVRAPLLRTLELAPRFGLETAMTIDAIRAGARVVEVDLSMEHRHTGRSVGGFRHRAGQGLDVVRAAWPRLTSPAQRIGIIVVSFALFCGAALWSGERAEPSSIPAAERPSKVVLFGIPKLGWPDIGDGTMPVLDRLAEGGAVAAMSVRTIAGRPSTTEGYATLGAGARVRADEQGGQAFEAGARLEGGTAAAALARRAGRPPTGGVVVVGAPAVARLNEDRHVPSDPGALGDALRRAGVGTAVVGNADTGVRIGRRPSVLRPAAVALMTSAGEVDGGEVERTLLQADTSAPFNLRADHDQVLAAVRGALTEADVVLVDPGDMDRAAEFAAVATPAAAAVARRQALAGIDALLPTVHDAAGPDALLLIVSVAPPGQEWHLTPMVALGPGVTRGYLHSSSTRRLGVVTLTDVAPTVLDAMGVSVPDDMIGHPLRYHPTDGQRLGHLRELDRDAAFREDIYFRLTVTYITIQAIVYLLAILAFVRLGGASGIAPLLRWIVLAISAYPLATFVLRAIPDVAVLDAGAIPLLIVIDLAVVALAMRARRHPLAPLAWVAGLTVAVLAFDVCTGARLQTSSLLGYSLHTAARFTGLGNTAFATLASTTILAAALHVHHAPRRREALVTAACILAGVVLVDGWPSLGSDVGGILTLVPVFGLTYLALAGRRISWRAVVAAVVVAGVMLGAATAVDLQRAPEARTHLGRFVTDVREDGWEPVTTTLQRKASANARTFRSPWTWTIPIVAVYMLYVLAWARGWGELLPARSALRAAAIGVLGAGVLGYALNDSGIVVTALVFVYIGPFLTLLALERERPGPVVLPAIHARARAPAS